MDDQATDKRVALKRLTWTGDDDSAQLRFRREFHAMASLQHPRIVKVLDYSVDDGVPQLIVSESHGASGYLYLRSASGLELVAPTWSIEPPAELSRALAAAIGLDDATIVDVHGPDGRVLRWRPVALALPHGSGGVVVIAGAMNLVGFDAGDVTQRDIGS